MAYKKGYLEPERKYAKLSDAMQELKDEWDFTTKSLYNPSASVLYDAYLVNLSHTVAMNLIHMTGRKVRVDLTQRKPAKKM